MTELGLQINLKLLFKPRALKNARGLNFIHYFKIGNRFSITQNACHEKMNTSYEIFLENVYYGYYHNR